LHIDNSLCAVRENIREGGGNANTRWAVEWTGKKRVYHRFEGDHNGNWHWNGSTAGQTKFGKNYIIEMSNVPVEIKRME
jgi:filamentous hemagglutinin